MRRKMKMLVRESSLLTFLGSFLRYKADGRSDEFINAMKKQDKDLGQAWEKYDNALDNKWNDVYQVLKQRGGDTERTEKAMRKYGIKIR